MTEKINVAVKKTLNRVHAVIALIFWILAGVAGFIFLHEVLYAEEVSILAIIAGIIIGIVRLFIINDKYAWQVATLEEIRELRKIIADLGIKKSIQSNLSSNTTGTKNTTSSTIKPEDVWVCTNCGETNPAGTKFCQKCGK